MRNTSDTGISRGHPHANSADGSIYGPEFGMPDGAELPEGTDLQELKTGTTTVGLRSEDGVLLATDMRASMGHLVSSKAVQKVEQIHPHGALTIAGSVSAAQSLIGNLRAEVSLYQTRRGKEMSMQALSTITANFLRSGAFLIVSPLLGGIDEEGTHVYSFDAIGGVTEEDYAFSGSGSQMALGVLEQEYDESLSIDECEEVALHALQSAMERDVNSGNGVNVARITEEGVDITRHEDLAELYG